MVRLRFVFLKILKKKDFDFCEFYQIIDFFDQRLFEAYTIFIFKYQMQSQTISVIYQDEIIPVDYIKLFDASRKFREMIQPFHDNGVELQKLQLRILYNKFSKRNVINFLKMVQNQKNNVHSNEIPEICELSRMFQVDKLYEKSLNYVQTQINPNFTVLDDFDESNGVKYLEIEIVRDLISQHSYSTSNINFDNSTMPPSPFSTLPVSKSVANLPTNQPQNQDQNPSAIYKIQVLHPPMKCCRYFFSKEGKILFTAKKKANEIYIGQGNDIHIKNNEECGRIMQCNGYNIADVDGQEIKITYIPFGVRKQYSIETSFAHEGKTLLWSPREIDVNLYGEHNHAPIPSKKNMLLKNQNGSPTFIVRKMENDVFECECVSTVNSLIAFSIALSQIVGPFN